MEACRMPRHFFNSLRNTIGIHSLSGRSGRCSIEMLIIMPNFCRLDFINTITRGCLSFPLVSHMVTFARPSSTICKSGVKYSPPYTTILYYTENPKSKKGDK